MAKATGLSSYESTQYVPDSSSYTLDQSGAKAKNDQRQADVDARSVPTAQAAQTNLSDLYKAQLQDAQVAQSQGVQLANAERAQAAQIGQANTSQNVNLGNAAQANAAQLNSQDAQFRNNQVALSNNLTAQMNGQGPSLAANQYQAAQEANLKGQMGAAAAMGGRNSALGGRQLAMNAASQGQQTARDVANIRTQEQLNATSQLANVSQTGRTQDIDLASQNAQLQQQAALENQKATNQFGLNQGQMNLQNQQFNAGVLNSRQDAQASLNQQANLANQQYGNQFALAQGQMNLQNNQYNSTAQNNANLQNASLQAQNQANYQSQYNQTLGQNTTNQQGTNLANQQADLQNRQQQDAMSQFYQGSNAALDARQQDALMQYEADKIRATGQQDAVNAQAYADSANKQGGVLGSVMGAAGSLTSMSDKNAKHVDAQSRKRGNEKMADFLGSYQSSTTSVSDEKEKDKNPAPVVTPAAAPAPTMQAPTPVVAPPAATTTETPAPAPKTTELQAENNKYKAIIAGMNSRPQAAVNNPSSFGAGLVTGGQFGGGLVASHYANKIAKNEAALSDQKVHDMEMNKSYAGHAPTGFVPGSDQTVVGYQAPAIQQSPQQQGFSGMSSPDLTGSSIAGGIAGGTETSDINAKNLSSSSIGSKTGISSGNMQVQNFMQASANKPKYSGDASGRDMTPITYDRINSNGSMDVQGSLENHSNTAMAYQTNASNYSDNPGSNLRRAGGPGPAMGGGFGISPGGSAPGGPASPSKTADNSQTASPGGAGPGQTKGSGIFGGMSGIGDIFKGKSFSKSSDEKSKTSISSDDDKVKEYLQNIHAYEYSYKNPELPGRGEGRFVSPMAQELEKSEAGKAAVQDTPQGKMVDYGKLMGVNTAALAYLNEEVNKLKGEKNTPAMVPPKADRKK